jgi:membrane-associated phospholipid phosphatase
LETISLVQQLASPVLDVVMFGITQLGSEEAYITFLLIWYLGLDPVTGRRLAVYFLGGAYINQELKNMFNTARPFELDPTVLRLGYGETATLSPGFPSGHAQSAATFWGLAAAYVRKRSFTAIAVVLVLAVAISRVYLGVHVPVDVMGGLLIGLAIVSLGLGLDRAWQAPVPWLGVTLGLTLPLAVHLTFPSTDSNVILGSLAGFLTGPILVTHLPRNNPVARLLISVLGLVLVFGYLLGASLLLSDAAKDHSIVGFIRYLILAYVGVVVVPLIGRPLRLSLGRP